MASIVVEGPIGVGKTSLARLLADRIGARLVLEVVEENPFLARFYEDPERFAFNAQAFFLLSRYRQSQESEQGSLFTPHTVSDYLFAKDWIFASLNLRGAEWELYQDLYRSLAPKLQPPDLIVYLRADPELLLERIEKRGRPFEAGMDPAYLRRLGEAYDLHFAREGGPVHVIEATHVDFVASEADREALVADVLDLARVAA